MEVIDQDERARRALDLRRAGVVLPQIVREVGFKDTDEAAAAIRGALDALGIITDPEENRLLSLDRIDRMIQGAWLKAAKGDPLAIDRVSRLIADRTRLVGSSPSTVMVDEFDKSIDALSLAPEDGAIVSAGRRIAEKIDAAAGGMDPVAETKALYLVPHLVNLLRELGATPAARAALKRAAAAKEGESRGKLADLRALRGGKKPAGEEAQAG